MNTMPGGRSCDEAAVDVACTAQGAVRGTTEAGIVAFKGIPYAEPPVGELRWRPPAMPVTWAGVRDGSRFGAICPQLSGTQVIGEENCLTLNVWKPAERPAAPLPVMVFFPGGGNHGFSGQGAPVFGGVGYGGEKLVPEGVVHVSFNYRLGALGFLAHPELSAASTDKVSGNYGTLDQIAMLRWVHENIASFGGDPRRVMLFGTSAGGGNICTLLAAPGARGLFHRAAMQASVPTGCELPTLAQAESGTGQRVADSLGCTSGDRAACLRSRPAADVVRAVPGTFSVLPRVYGPNVDGRVIPEQPRAAIARGAHAQVPVIIGNSSNETMLFVNALGPVTDRASYEAAIGKVFGEAQTARIVEAYPTSPRATPRQALVQLTTDAFFTCQSRRVARALTAHQHAPALRYFFTHSLENDPDQKALGAMHTVEHPFFFAWGGAYKPTDTDLAVQRLMVGHWTHFARTGSPPAAWPLARLGDAYLSIGATSVAARGDGGAQCDFWDTVPLPQPHL
jgi:para-nitrobenzyl esterase